MRLRLLLRGPSRLLSAIPDKVLENGHIVIGRSPEADWMIADPDKVISKAHCRIDRTERGFMLTDTSTNGVRVNDVPVGRGLPSLLADGDVLMLGDAVIGVEVQAAAAAPGAIPVVNTPPAAVVPPVATAPAADPATEVRPANPFRDGPFGFDAEEIEQPVAAKAAAPLPAAANAEPILQDWWDPNAASGKPGLPLSADTSPGSAGVDPVPPVLEHTHQPSQSGETQMLSWAAGSIDAKRLLQAVETAAQVLSKDERENFERRLREILQQESMHSH